MKTRSTLPKSALAAALLAAPVAVHAHHAEFMSNHPLLQGLSMPVHGVDHLLSAVAVGLLAGRLGGRARLSLPLLFTMVALLGGLLNLTGVALPECSVPLSLGAAGLLLYLGAPTAAIAAGVVACAGLFNGQALLETPQLGLNGVLFAAGCVASALALCGTGLLASRLFEARPGTARLTGAFLLAAAGVLTLFPEINGAVIRLIE